MRNSLLLLSLVSTLSFSQVVQLPPLPTSLPLSKDTKKLDLQQMSISALLNLIFLEYKVSYVLDPSVLEDPRQVSLRWDSKKQKLDDFLVNFLNSVNLELNKTNGVYFVTKKTNMTNGLLKKVYFPKNRTSDYLINNLSPFFPNNFPSKSGKVQVSSDVLKPNNPPSGSVASMLDSSEVVLFQGTQNEWLEVNKILTLLDVEEKNLKIKARIYELTTTSKDGYGFKILGSLMVKTVGGLGEISGGFGGATTALNFLSFNNEFLTGILSFVDSNDKFKLISSPFLTVKNGKSAEFFAGEDVPILGSIVSDGNGKSTQSVDYKPSGVIFKVSPKIKENSIDLNVEQTLSQFISTTTGLTSSPTLTKRSIKTDLVITPDSTVVIGGLRTLKSTKNDAGLWIIRDKSNEETFTEILLFITVEKDLTEEVKGAIN